MAFFERLGNIGVLLIAGALLIGGLAGGAVVYHFERAASNSVASQHRDGDHKGGAKQPKKKGQDKQRHQNQQKGESTNQAETD